MPVPHFTPAERQATLDRLLAELHTDARLAGVLIVGSAAVGFEDALSDIDLAVVVASEDEVEAVWQDWRGRIAALFPVIGCSSMQRAPNVFLHAMLLGGFLELDISFQSPGSLIARHERWKVAFDHTGQIEQSMRESWASRADPDVKAIYVDNIKGIWHYIVHVAVATRRGQVWRAISDLEVIRDRAVELAGLRLGLDTKRYREVDHLPPEFLAALQDTLVRSVEPAEIMRALRAAVQCFFGEARQLDALYDLTLARDLEAYMQAYLDTAPT